MRWSDLQPHPSSTMQLRKSVYCGQRKASAHMDKKAIKKANHIKQYKTKCVCFAQTKCNMLCFNIKHLFSSYGCPKVHSLPPVLAESCHLGLSWRRLAMRYLLCCVRLLLVQNALQLLTVIVFDCFWYSQSPTQYLQQDVSIIMLTIPGFKGLNIALLFAVPHRHR